jgi:steroid delta-isomerase-like uncharacterized protein
VQALSIAQQYFDAWNRHDADAIVGLFSEAGTYSDPSTGGPLQGPAIGDNAARLWASFPDLRFEIISVDETSDDVVAAQWMMLGTNDGSMFGLPPTGKLIELPGADFVTIKDGKIESVVGYFDSGVLPRQIGMQVLVQPHEVGPFAFGRATTVHGPRPDRPGAFSITLLNCADPGDQAKVSEHSRQIAIQMLEMDGFLGWTGLTAGGRMVTITAWESPEHAAQVMKDGTHREAMRLFFADNSVSTGAWTSVWKPERINTLWSRCESCGKMVNADQANGVCECGVTLPSLSSWW